nr:hypothetical protein [Mixta theicola]
MAKIDSMTQKNVLQNTLVAPENIETQRTAKIAKKLTAKQIMIALWQH